MKHIVYNFGSYLYDHFEDKDSDDIIKMVLEYEIYRYYLLKGINIGS